jgi:hypothetical protein
MKKLTTSLAAVLASVALLHTAATAQTANTGDLILGFQTASPNAGNSDNLEVDLGASTNFTSTAAFSLSSDLSVSDITGTYGSGSSALYFGVIGTLGSAGSADDISFLTAPVGTTIPTAGSKNTLGLDVESKADTLYSGFGNGSTTGLTGTSDGVVPGAGASGTYTYAAGTNGTVGNYVTQGIQALYNPTGSESLSLYELAPGQNTLLGTLDLTVNESTGTEALTFVGSAVPEPQTYLMMGMGLLGLGFLVRRRISQA